MALTYTYCTEADIDRFASAGAKTAFGDHDESGTADSGVVQDAINYGTEIINLFCGERYADSALASSVLINRWCTVIASVKLSITRGNMPPESWLNEEQRIMDLMEKIRADDMDVPGLSQNFDQRPSFSNLEIDRRYNQAKIRVQKAISSDQTTSLTQNQTKDYPTVL